MMTAGLPDYYRGVDVAYQALAQMIVRPKYGGATRTFTSMVVDANVQTELLNISGRGMIYGGFLYVSGPATQRNSLPMLRVDGSYMGGSSFDGLNAFSILIPRTSVVVLHRYDDVNFVYSVGFSYGLTFESSLTLHYLESHGATPTVQCDIVYALI